MKDIFTKLRCKKGFTLLEMLVVVLIIGILAGTALPKYTQSVEKSHLAEALIAVSSLQKAIDSYILENGYPDFDVYFLGSNKNGKLDIDITDGLDCSESYVCYNKNFSYQASCSDSQCEIFAQRTANGGPSQPEDYPYELYLKSQQGADYWEKECYYYDEFKKGYICKYLESQGFDNRGGC